MVSVNLDITFLIQMVNFLIALVVLNYVIIRPIRSILKQRRELMLGLLEESESFNNMANSRLRNYEAELEEARARAGELKEQIRKQGVDAEQSILSEAQNEAQSLLQKSRKEISQDVDSSMRILREQVGDMAGKVVSKVLS